MGITHLKRKEKKRESLGRGDALSTRAKELILDDEATVDTRSGNNELWEGTELRIEAEIEKVRKQYAE